MKGVYQISIDNCLDKETWLIIPSLIQMNVITDKTILKFKDF